MKLSLNLLELIFIDDSLTLYTGEEHTLSLRPTEASAKVSSDMGLIKKINDGIIALIELDDSDSEAELDLEYLELWLLREIADSKLQMGENKRFGFDLKMKILKAINVGYETLTNLDVTEDARDILKDAGITINDGEEDEEESDTEKIKRFQEQYNATAENENNSTGHPKAKRASRTRKTL